MSVDKQADNAGVVQFTTMVGDGGGITEILTRAAEGDRIAQREACERMYSPMHELARKLLRRESRNNSLQTTDLLNETVEGKLVRSFPAVKDLDHFMALFTKLMKQSLVDRARRRWTRRMYVNAPPAGGHDLAPELVIAVRDELCRLRAMDPGAARIVELRVLENKSLEETAAATGRSLYAVRSDYDFAISWLRDRLRR